MEDNQLMPWRNLWISIGIINIPLFLTGAKTSMRNLTKFSLFLQHYSLVSPLRFLNTNTSQAASENKTIPVWDRWKWWLIGSLKASKTLEDDWVRRSTFETWISTPVRPANASWKPRQFKVLGLKITCKIKPLNTKQFRCISLIRPKATCLHVTHGEFWIVTNN